jgi:hypothetical protein
LHSNEQRLTELGPQIVVDRFPTWPANGALIVFTRNYLAATMNADGTCESVIGSDEPSYFGFSWQAVPGGPPLEPKRCHAISVEARIRAAGRRVAWDSITATVRNEGTEPLTNVELFVSSSHDLDLEGGQDCQVHGFGARCPIGSLGRSESRRLRLVGLPRRAGGKGLITVQSKLSLRVVADETLLLTRREEARPRFTAVATLSSRTTRMSSRGIASASGGQRDRCDREAYDVPRMKLRDRLTARRRRKAHERYIQEREWQQLLAEKDTAITVKDAATTWGVAGQATSGPGTGL